MVSRTIWKRRVVLMALVGLAVAVPLTLLLAGDDPEAPDPTAVMTTPIEPPPQLSEADRDDSLRVRYRVPKGWKESKQASAIRLRSRDSTAEIVIAAPAPAGEADGVLDEALAAIRDGYEAVEVSPGSGRKIGGLKAKGAVISAKSDGAELRIVVAVAPGDKHAYLVEVFTAAGVSGERLREAQVALNSLELNG